MTGLDWHADRRKRLDLLGHDANSYRVIRSSDRVIP